LGRCPLCSGIGDPAGRSFLDRRIEGRSMTYRLFLLLSCLLLVPAAWTAAHAERLIVSVSNHRVTVTPNYSGDELVLFGSIERDGKNQTPVPNYDIVVTVSGP